MSRNLILLAEFGSVVYGTSMPSSDKDYKGVFLPTADEILLQRVPKSIVENTKKNSSDKNTADDVDKELFSISKYIDLLMENQTPALDLFFTPKEHFVSGPAYWWLILHANKDKFLNKNVSSFVSYTKAQAAKYGVKGFRVNALEITLAWLNGFHDHQKLFECDVEKFVKEANSEHIKITMCRGPNGVPAPHLEVCNRKVGMHVLVKYARDDVFKKIYDNYGHRAKLAQKNEGLDLKALYHAVRVAREAEELLLTGNITFPRPEVDLLMKIRRGELTYEEIEPIIEEGLDRVEAAKQKSSLPEKPNREFAEELVKEIHEKIIRNPQKYNNG